MVKNLLKINITNEALSAFFFKGVTAVKGPILVLALVYFLTPEQQGYWYLITNLGAIIYMADFGLTVLTMQFIANHSQNIINVHELRKIFKPLISSTYKFLLISVLYIFVIFLPIGIYVIGTSQVEYSYAWLIYLASAIPVHILLLESSILQGMGKVTTSYIIRSSFILLSFVLCIYLLSKGFSVASLGISNLISSIIILILFIAIFYSKSFKNHDHLKNSKSLIISKKIRYQYITSWVSGYFMFFMIVPLVMLFEGPIVAGQIGVSLTLIKSISAISLAPIESSLTDIGKAYGQRNRSLFEKYFKNAFTLGVIIYIFSALFSIFLLMLLNNLPIFEGRLPELKLYFILLIAEFAYFIISSIAKKVRVLLKEPFAIINIFLAFLIFCNAIIFLNFFNLYIWSIMQAMVYILIGIPLFYKKYIVSFKNFF